MDKPGKRGRTKERERERENGESRDGCNDGDDEAGKDHGPRLEDLGHTDGRDPTGHEAAVVGLIDNDRLGRGQLQGTAQPIRVRLKQQKVGDFFRVHFIFDLS